MFNLNNVICRLKISENTIYVYYGDILISKNPYENYLVKLNDGEYDVVVNGKEINYNGCTIIKLSNFFAEGVKLTLTKDGFYLKNRKNKVADAINLPKGLFINREWYPVIIKNDNEYMIVRYANLHQHTEYSLLDGITRIPGLARKTEWACAITDHGNMHGFNEFYQEMIKQGKKPIIGCEVYVETIGGEPRKIYNATDNDSDDRMFDNEKEPKSTLAGEHLILLAENNKGLHNLFKLVTEASNYYYRKPHVTYELLEKYHDGLICTSACIAGTAGRSIKEMLKTKDIPEAKDVYDQNAKILKNFIEKMIEIFGKDNFFIELQNHHFDLEDRIMAQLRIVAKKYGLKTTIGIDAHYLNKEDKEVHNLWLCKQTKVKYNDPKRMQFSGDGYWVHTSEEVVDLFPNDLDALDNTLNIAERCNVTIESEGYHLPVFPLPEGFNSENEYLKYLCNEGFKRISLKLESDKKKQYRDRLKYEMSVIENMGWESYFLVVQDFIAYAKDDCIKDHLDIYFPKTKYKQDKIPDNIVKDYEVYVGSGRGSAAGSLVAYVLGITEVDPLEYNLLFERFLNPDRISMPDIDIDFEDAGREQIIEYCRYKYGENNVARVVTFGTAGAKNALRSISSTLDNNSSFTNKLAEFIPAEPGWTLDKALNEIPEFKYFCETDKQAKTVLEYAKQIEGLVMNRSIHACALNVTAKPITNYMPEVLMNNPQNDEPVWVTQLQGTELEDKGLLKMDFLGLRTLGVAHEAIKLIKQNHNISIKYDEIPLDDKKIYEYLSSGNTQGVFQAESDIFIKALTGALKDWESQDPETLFMRVSDCNALVRPGPNQYMGDYAKRVADSSLIKVADPSMEEELKPTMGLMLYQEQVMRLAQKMAGFSAGQSDSLRKAMGKKIPEMMAEYREYFIYGSKDKKIKGCVNNGINENTAIRVWEDIEKFAGYGFNKSHAVAYSYHTVRTAWLAYYYPVEYFTAILNSYIDSADDISKYISICKQKGIEILPPSINDSEIGFSTDGISIRFGLGGIRNVNVVAQTIFEERDKNYFISYEDFIYRVKPNKRVIESLIMSGALDDFYGNRNMKLSAIEDTLKLIKKIKQAETKNKPIYLYDVDIELNKLEEMPYLELLKNEFYATGFYISGHPLDEYSKYKYDDCISKLEDNQKKVSLLVLVKEVVTKHSKKSTNSFKTFKVEDQTGILSSVCFNEDCYDSIEDNAILQVKGYTRTDDFGKQLIVTFVNRKDI